MRSLIIAALTIGIAAAALLSPGGAGAQEMRNAGERSKDRQDIRQDRRAIADDACDLDRLSDLVFEWNALRATGGSDDEMARVLREIDMALRSDLAESAIQTAEAEKETREAAREIRSDRREVRRDRREVKQADISGNAAAEARARHELRDDRRDRRDDRRDRRDDARDAKQAEEMLVAKRAIRRELVDLQKRIDGSATDPEPLRAEQMTLLERYLELSRREIEMGFRELSEDRRELREDRRETREDRRQR